MRALEDEPSFVKAFVSLVTARTVCVTCGLRQLGHSPDSRRLGFADHQYEPRKASDEDLAAARRLTEEALT